VRGFTIFCFLILFSFAAHAQAPQGLNYQALARNMDGSVVSGQPVNVRFSILNGSTAGAVVYQETHLAKTNNSGLFTLAIGRGNVASGSFVGIDWGAASKFLKVEIAVGGGGYQLQGTTQLLSVPYALYAEKSGNGGTQGLTGPQGPAGAQGPIGPAGPSGATGKQGPAGATGPQGPVGLTGAVGLQGLAGPIGPAGAAGPQGIPGATGLTGQMGVTGAAGLQGAMGPQGANGKTILNGTSNPASTVGVPGDFFLNTTTSQLFGPKTVAGWSTGVSLIGSAGGPPGLKSLIDLEDFPGTATCPAGGVTVKSGIDQNNNGILDAIEVDNSKQICFKREAALDKIIILPIPGSNSNTQSTSPLIGGSLLKFNKNNYPGVDSVILACDPYGSAIVTLYNMTNQVTISNSTLISNGNVAGNYIETGNLFSVLPTHTVTIGVSLRSADDGKFASSSWLGCYLYLYRK
jgi:hypothetical protein